MKLYKYTCMATSLVFIFLFFQLMLGPESFVQGMGLEPSVASIVIIRRAAMFMLGLSVLTFLVRNISDAKVRQIISISTGITLLGLACMGIYEYSRGTVNNSIFIAISIESILGLLFMTTIILNKATKSQ